MNNAALLARSRSAVWHPCTQMKQHETTPLVPISRGSGSWLYDFDGHRYLDAISSWWVNLFGHGHPAINAAIVDELAKLEHVMLAGFTHQPVVELSERLSAIAPGNPGHCFYGSDGASAVEIALKMSFHYWRNACRAALAVLDLFRDKDVLAANRASAAKLDELARPLAAHPKVRNFRRLGMIWAFEVVDGQSGERDNFARWFAGEALTREMLLRPIGRTVYWMPPYCLGQDEMAILASRTLEIVACA